MSQHMGGRTVLGENGGHSSLYLHKTQCKTEGSPGLAKRVGYNIYIYIYIYIYTYTVKSHKQLGAEIQKKMVYNVPFAEP